MLALSNDSEDKNLKFGVGDNSASATWPSVNVYDTNIKVEVVHATDTGGTVKITAYKAGTLNGTYIDGYGGAQHQINDTFTSGETKTYTGYGGTGTLYGIFQ